jgi:hypothetical protein
LACQASFAAALVLLLSPDSAPNHRSNMESFGHLTQQLYLVRSLTEQKFLTQRVKALLKGLYFALRFAHEATPPRSRFAGLILAGDKEIADICSQPGAVSLGATADRLFERAGMSAPAIPGLPGFGAIRDVSFFVQLPMLRPPSTKCFLIYRWRMHVN